MFMFTININALLDAQIPLDLDESQFDTVLNDRGHLKVHALMYALRIHDEDALFKVR